MLDGWKDNYIEQLRSLGITCLYHITDKDNLASVLKERGLSTAQQLERNGITCPRPGGDAITHRLDRRLQRFDAVHLYAYDPTDEVVPSMQASGRFGELCVLSINIEAIRPQAAEFWIGNPYAGGEKIDNVRDLAGRLTKDPSLLAQLSVDIRGSIHINHVISGIPENIWSRISEVHPTAIVFVVDQSCSMSRGTVLDNVEYDYISDLVAEAINAQIDSFLKKCIAEDGTVCHLYDIAVIGYGNGVSPAWSGELADKAFHSPVELLSHVKGPSEQFRWVEARDSDTKGRCDLAMEYVYDLLKEWTSREENRFSYPPTVIHVSDADVQREYEEPFLLYSQRLKSLSTESGNVIVWNLGYIPHRFREYVFVSGEDLLALMHAESSLIMYEASSYLPETFREKAAAFHKKNPDLARKTMGLNVRIQTLFNALQMCVLPE